MTTPDPAGRQECCDAPAPDHWEDCPDWEFYRAGGYWRRRTPLRAGWVAECDDCPGVVEPDYGALVYPREEFVDTDCGRWAAERWAIAHREANPGHSPTVQAFARTTFTLAENIDPEVWRRLFSK